MVVATEADQLKYDYFTLDRYSAVECSYIEALSIIIEELSEQSPPTNSSVPMSSLPIQHVAPSAPHATRAVALPKIKIPTFDGKYLDWPSFKDLYSDLIHNNDSLTAVQKLHYLKSNVEGEAATLLKSISITSANYQSAWQTLIDRYENTRVICNHHFRTLFSLTNISKESPTELKRLHDTTFETIRSLKQLGRPTDNWDDLIVFMTVKHLDPKSRVE